MNNSYKPSKEFSNRAWKDMKARLDVEMPTHERKPFAWFLWGFGLLFVFGISLLSKDGGQKSTQPIATAAMIPVADLNQKDSKSTTEQVETALAKTETSNTQNTVESVVTTQKVPVGRAIVEGNFPKTHKVLSQKTLEKRANTSLANVNTDKVKVAVVEESVSANAPSKITQLRVEQAANTVASTYATPALSNRKLSVLDFYPSFNQESSTPKTYAAIIKPVHKIQPKTRLACGLGLSYGAINERGNTWSFGGEVDVIFKERFSLGANMAYRQRQYRQSNGQFLYIQEDDLQQATGLDAMTISTYELNYVSPELIAFQVDQIESMEFGLHPSFRVVDKLWLEGRFSGIRARSIGTVEQDNVNSFRSDNVSTVVENAFTEWDILYGGGIRYQFNPHIGINLCGFRFQPENLQHSDLFDRNTSASSSLSNSLPLISQPLFVEMGISFRL